MNYNALIKNLREEIKIGHQYRTLDYPFKALAFISMLPFIAVTISIFISFYCLLFVYNALLSGVKYLETWLDDTKKDVNPATQAILYFCTIPTIFAMRVLLSTFSLLFYFLWFSVMCSAYVSSLGGVRWQPYISDATFGGVSFTPNTNGVAAKTFSVISFVLFAICVLIFLIFLGTDSAKEARDVATAFVVVAGLDAAFVNISVPIIFRKRIVDTSEE